jgi:signal peptidase I
MALVLTINESYAQVDSIRSNPITIPLHSIPDVTSEWELLVMPARNMEPTIPWKTLLLFAPLRLTQRTPQYGDVISYDISNANLTPDQDAAKSKKRITYIMRVVGIPGDKIEIRNGILNRNGLAIAEPYANLLESSLGTRSFKEIQVPEKSIYVLGDNRGNSDDSRLNGPISLDRVQGIAKYIGEVRNDSSVSYNWRPLSLNLRACPSKKDQNFDCIYLNEK